MRRLLASLGRADLSSVATPHLTVEVPAIIDKPLEDFLNTYNWPRGPRTSSKPSLLTLRRRVARTKLDPEESAARFLESFWPANPVSNHVLVLSPHVEVSPHFFHCKFTVSLMSCWSLNPRRCEVRTASVSTWLIGDGIGLGAQTLRLWVRTTPDAS